MTTTDSSVTATFLREIFAGRTKNNMCVVSMYDPDKRKFPLGYDSTHLPCYIPVSEQSIDKETGLSSGNRKPMLPHVILHQPVSSDLSDSRIESTVSNLPSYYRAWFLTLFTTDETGKRKGVNTIDPLAIVADYDKGVEAPTDDRLTELGLPLPTVRVKSGGGYHLWWFLEEDSCTKEQRKDVVVAIVAATGADPAMKDAARVLRLPGSIHLKNPVDPKIVTILESNYDRRYTYADFEVFTTKNSPQVKQTATPINKPKPAFFPHANDFIPPIPIERCLTKAHREALAHGVGDGCRTNTGVSLAKDLVGAAAKLESLGESYSGDPRSLFNDYCSRCAPPLTVEKEESIWGATKGVIDPSINDDVAFKNCIDKWKRECTKSYQQISSAAENSSGTSVEGADKQSAGYQHLSAPYQQLSAAEIKKQVEEIVERHLPAVDRQTELIALSRRLGVSKISLDGLVQELEHATSNSADNAEMDKILIAQSHKLSPHLVLPAQLANKIEQISNARSTNPEPLLLGLLVAASSVPHANTRLDVRNYGDVLSVYPNLFGMVVGDSSMLKSPTIKSTYIKPLKALRKIFIEKHKTELDQYTRELTEWETQDKKDRGQEPKSPTLTVVSAVDTTIEKLEELALNQPHICPSLFRDEVIGIFQSFDKHGGKGTNDGLSKLLSYYDGQPIDRHRMGTGSQLSDHDFHPSVFGGIQPDVLKKLAIAIGMDDAGTLCRFLYAPISRTYKDWDEEPDRELIDVSAFDSLICQINQLPPLVCSLERAGQQAWAKIANRHNKACLNNPHISQWLKHSYSKAIGQLGKIALTLHLIECVTADKKSTVISAATIKRAGIALDYFISQAISLIASTEETLEAHLVRILDKAKKLGSIKPRDVQALFSGKKRIDSTTARNYLQQLVQSGYGVVDDAGAFTPNQLDSFSTASADNADKVLITYQQPDSSSTIHLNNFVDNADNILQSDILLNPTQENRLDPSQSNDGSGSVPPQYPDPETTSIKSEPLLVNGKEEVDKLSADYQHSHTAIVVGSLVKPSDPYNFRGNDVGTVEQIDNGKFQVWWQTDGDRQIPAYHRTFTEDELAVIPDSDKN